MTFLAERLQPSRLKALSSRLYEVTQTDCFSQSTFVHINEPLLWQLDIDKLTFAGEDNLSFLLGNQSIPHLQPISTVYEGH